MTNAALTTLIRNIFGTSDFIPLHAPYFGGNEKKYLMETIDTTFVSSVGSFVNHFEEMMASYTGARHAVACVNGTSALHTALLVCGVERGSEVLTQALTFVATANAISYTGAMPVFVDVDQDSMGMSPVALKDFLEKKTIRGADGNSYNKNTGRRISACVPMHTFGMPCRIDQIAQICSAYNIQLVEDAAESLGSYYKNRHTGTFGAVGVFSFNGNKTITCGGGGALITDNPELASRAKHLTTQAKVAHRWEFNHDAIGYNYRMPNLNAALACAQLEQLDHILVNKRELANLYRTAFQKEALTFVDEIPDARSNFWLNAILCDSITQRNELLKYTNDHGVMTRPVWELMTDLPMFANCAQDGLVTTKWLKQRIVNLPSSFRKL